MRRATALRLLSGCVFAASFSDCAMDDPCASFPVPASTGSPTTPTQFGSTIYTEDDIERALALIAGCGGSIVRVGLNNNMAFSDAAVAAATAHHMRIVLISPYADQPVDVHAYASSCAAIHQRYAEYNPIWEIWNEPNLSLYWGAQPNVDAYARLAISTATALRAAGARDVWSGGTSGVDVTWVADLVARGAFSVMNGCAVHAYAAACGVYGQYVRLSRALPANIPIHTTETCIPSTQDQNGYIRQMWYIHRLLGLATMIWCELRDGTAGNSGAYTLPYGLVYPDYAPKSSYYTIKRLATAASSSTRA